MRRAAVVVLCLLACACSRNPEPKPSPNLPTYKAEAPPELAAMSVNELSLKEAKSAQGENCDSSLWTHVYHGTYATAKDRLVPQSLCTTITGVLVDAKPEGDGDLHIHIKLDSQYASMLNPRNKDTKHKGQHGYFVIEPVCTKTPVQSDTVQEKVCDGFTQKDLYNAKTMKGKRVQVTGAYVTDVEAGHGWNEIHPVTKITVIP